MLTVGRRTRQLLCGRAIGAAGRTLASQPQSQLPTMKDSDHERATQLPSELKRRLAVLFGSQFMVTAGFGAVIPVLPALAASLDLGASSVGLFLSVPSVARVLLNLPMGRWSDLHGRKPLMVAGTLATSIGAIAVAFSGSLPAVLAARLVAGVGSAASMAGSSAYLGDLTRNFPHKRGAIMGMQGAVMSSAFIAGPALGGWVGAFHGTDAVFLVVGCATMLCSVGYSTLPDTFQRAATVATLDSDKSPVVASWWAQNLALLQSRQQQAVLSVTMLLMGGYAAQMTMVPLLATDLFAATSGQIGLLFSCIAGLGLVTGPVAGRLSDKYGPLRILFPAATLVTAGSLLLAFADSQATFALAMVLWGIGQSAASPALSAYAVHISPPHGLGQAQALHRQAGDITMLIAPVSLGVLAESLGNHGGALLAFSGFAALQLAVFSAVTNSARLQQLPILLPRK